MTQTWDEIYRLKTTLQLYRVFLNGTIDEKLLAKKILEERDFEFNNIEKYKEEWELEKLFQEEKEMNFSSDTQNKFPWFGIWSIAPIIAILAIVIGFMTLIYQLTIPQEKDIISPLIFIAASIALYFVSIAILTRNKKEKTKRRAKIDYLKNKIIDNKQEKQN